MAVVGTQRKQDEHFTYSGCPEEGCGHTANGTGSRTQAGAQRGAGTIVLWFSTRVFRKRELEQDLSISRSFTCFKSSWENRLHVWGNRGNRKFVLEAARHQTPHQEAWCLFSEWITVPAAATLKGRGQARRVALYPTEVAKSTSGRCDCLQCAVAGSRHCRLRTLRVCVPTVRMPTARGLKPHWWIMFVT